MRLVSIFSLLLLICGPTYGQVWKTYYDSTQVYWNVDWEKTSQLLQRAKNIAMIDLGIYSENYLAICEDLGICYMQLGELKKSEATLTACLENKQEIMPADQPSYLHTVTLLAELSLVKKETNHADSLFKHVLRFDSTNFHVLKGLAGVYEQKDMQDSAHIYYTRAFKVMDETSELTLQDEVAFKSLFADFERKNQNYTLAHELFESVNSTFTNRLIQHTELPLYAQFLNNYGLFLLETGQYGSAEKALLESLRIWDGLISSQPMHRAESLNSLASLYTKLGFFEKAKEYLLRSLDICTSTLGKRNRACFNILNNLASITLRQGDTDEAIAIYEDLRKQLQDDSSRDYINVTNNLAIAYRKAGRLSEAEAIYLGIKANTEVKRLFPLLYASVLNNLGMMHLKKEAFLQAEEHLIQAIALKRQILGPDNPMITENLYNLASLYQITGELAKAAPLYEEAYRGQMLMIRYLFPGFTSHQKMQYHKQAKQNLEQYCSFAIEYYKQDPDILANLMNRQLETKGLLFYSDKRILNRLENIGDSLLIAKYNQLKNLRLTIAKQVQQENKTDTDIGKLVNEAEALEKELAVEIGPATTGLAHQGDWQDVKAKLSENEALVELIRFRKFDISSSANIDYNSGELALGFTDSIYYAALIVTSTTEAHPDLVLLKNGRDLEGKLFRYYSNALRYQIDDKISYYTFWKPINDALHNRNKIYLVNDGIYHHMNLEILLNPKTNRYLLENQSIQYLTNSMELLNSHDRSLRRPNKTALLLGNPDYTRTSHTSSEQQISAALLDSRALPPLPGTKKEVMEIGMLLDKKNWNLNILTGPNASENVLRNMKSPGILHMATHGFFMSQRSSFHTYQHPLMQSGLYLAGAEKAFSNNLAAGEPIEGILTAYELMNYDLSDTRLVVLSACETALGEIEPGEGVYGLQRAIQMAGAKNVVHSLWTVDDDATQQLMTYFYQYLLQDDNATPKKALHKAQLHLKQTYSHPYYWGGFVVAGS